MFKIINFIVCVVVAVYFTSILAFEASVRQQILQLTTPIVKNCSEIHGVSQSEIVAAQATGREVQDLNSCFLGCMLQKTNVVSEDGGYNTDTALNVLSSILGVEAGAIYAAKAKYCGYVNNQTYCDGTAGCEIAKAVLLCFRLQNIEIVFC